MFKPKVVSVITGVLILISATSLVAAKSFNHTDLYRYLIDLKGWDATGPTGSSLDSKGMQMVTVERTYRKGKMEMHVEIVIGPAAMGMWAPFAAGFSMENPEELFKTLKIKGLPAGVNHRKKSKDGAVVVLLSEGKETGKGSIFMINYLNMDYRDVVSLTEGFPLQDLKKLMNE
ncbi:MAG: hypothetical protein D6710_00395 [Nitrospirae bacterium]|nr:MAG: hypothetical protein D6710_00395 [Nitrospirota bacterium]